MRLSAGEREVTSIIPEFESLAAFARQEKIKKIIKKKFRKKYTVPKTSFSCIIIY